MARISHRDVPHPVTFRRSRKCPICGETGIPIAYEYPTGHLFDAADMKLIELRGCVIVADMPTWWCEKDQYGWDGPDPARAIREAMRQVETQFEAIN